MYINNKIIQYILVGLIYVLNLNFVDGQTTNSTSKDMILKGSLIGNTTVLKWIPGNPDLYATAKANGITITRYTLTGADGEPLSEGAYTSSKIILTSSLKPMTVTEWNAFSLRNVTLDTVVKAILRDSFVSAINGNKLSDALYYNQKKENGFTYMGLIADQDIHIARSLALAYIDSTSVSTLDYRYFVTINGTTVKGVVDVQAAKYEDFPLPTLLSTESGDKLIDLTWSSLGMDEYYTFYDIFRSDDNGNEFIKVNEQPFVFMASEEKQNNSITFRDRVPQNGVSYWYKVRGISPYGIDGPFSELVEGKARRKRINLQIDAPVITYKIDSSATVKWNITNKDSFDITNLLDRYDVLYRRTVADTADVLNTSPIAATIDSFVIVSPAPEGFYFVRLTDMAEYEYLSVAGLGQRRDSIPPAIPSGLNGTIDKNGQVKLTWAPNTEKDLLGYRVFYSYHPDGPFTSMISTHINGTGYTTKVDAKNANDTIYYRIDALDQRYNSSLMSSWIVLGLPDRSPPSNPILKRLTPTKDGVRIAWGLGGDIDLKESLVQRRKKKSTQWQTILTIPAGDTHYPPMPLLQGEFEPANFIDIDSLGYSIYQYRIMATDLSGNQSLSAVVDLKPYDDGKRGQIRPLTLELMPLGAIYNSTTNTTQESTGLGLPNNYIYPYITDISDSEAVKALDPNLLQAKSPLSIVQSNVIRITWRYETAMPSSIAGFEIYQKKPSDTPGNVSYTNPTDPPYILVRTVAARDARTIALFNNLSDYCTFIEDVPGRKVITTPVHYKIIARHSDGGFSTPVIELVTLPARTQ